MSNAGELEALIQRLANDRALLQRGETATRQAAVDPVLRALGWDTSNLDEVDPEVSDRSGGRVDYSLRANGRALVLLEAKAAKEPLVGHEDQLLGYAFRLGARLAVLTNGLNWWFYLPMIPERTWEQRGFFRVDFSDPDPARSAADLDRFLSRPHVVDGQAIEEAQWEFERRELDRRTQTALPVVWRRLVTDVDDPHGEMLHDLVAEAVMREVGRRPDRPTIHQFLLGNLSEEPPAEGRSQGARASRVDSVGAARSSGVPRAAGTRGESSGPAGVRRKAPAKRLAGFSLDGILYETLQWREMLIQVCNILIAEAGPRFTERVAALQGRVRPVFGRSPEGYLTPRQLANGLYVDVNLSADNCERRARQILQAVRGNDESFRIELAE